MKNRDTSFLTRESILPPLKNRNKYNGDCDSLKSIELDPDRYFYMADILESEGNHE